MARHSLAFYRPPALAITAGATAPNPGGPGVVIWSTVHDRTLVWDGTQWTAQEVDFDVSDAGAGSDRHYVHTQGVPADVWVVTHGLNKIPSVVIVDSAGDEVRGDVRHDSTTQATLTFAYPFSGAAYFN